MQLSSARSKIRSSRLLIEDQRFLLENLCCLLASGRLDAQSLAFKKICTIVRSKLSAAELSHMREVFAQDGCERPRKRVIIEFPDQKLEISEEEHELYRPYEQSELALRLFTGAVKESTEKPD